MTSALIQEVVDRGGDIDATQAQFSHLHNRLADALRAYLAREPGVGFGDVAVLLRQALLRSHLQAGGTAEEMAAATVEVPYGVPWPTDEQWNQFGLRVAPVGVGRVQLFPSRWSPDWLPVADAEAVEEATSERERRADLRIPIDGAARAFLPKEFVFYQTPGQREAVRSVFLTPYGSSVVVNLPTGTGKTLAFQLPALRHRADGGLVLVVVPTIALARDQETRFRELLPEAERDVVLAYHTGLSPEQRRTLRQGVAVGGIPILFTSPEAALGVLRNPLHQAARSGRLRIFAIDEAHVVAQWGESFRPDFQALAGLRVDLADAARANGHKAFRTLLLSATLNDEAVETLARLFPSIPSIEEGSTSRPVEIVSEVSLRPEPAYLVAASESAEQQSSRVLEAIRFLPRPLLLYTTLRADAPEWARKFRGLGLERVRVVVGGDMSTEVGESTLRDWRDGRVDIVVATSAFGLGMDHADVRSVAHACLPESVDRYYQEVGRSGRDGRASVGLMVWQPKDLKTAKRLAEETIIGEERAFERWQSLWNHPRRRTIGDLQLVPIDAVPPGYTVSSENNVQWNRRTLGLMVSAGLIEYAAPPAPSIEQNEDESDEAFTLRWRNEIAQYDGLAGLRVLSFDHQNQAAFEGRVSGIRATRIAADKAAFSRTVELTALKRPLQELLSETYRLPNWGVEVAISQLSCPVTRRRRIPVHPSNSPPLATFQHAVEVETEALRGAVSKARAEPSRIAWIAYEQSSDPNSTRKLRESVRALLERLAKEGVVEFSARADWGIDWRRLAEYAPTGFVVTGESVSDPLEPPRIWGRATVLSSDATAADVGEAQLAPHPLHIVIAPRGVASPQHPTRPFFDSQSHVSIAAFVRSLDQ